MYVLLCYEKRAIDIALYEIAREAQTDDPQSWSQVYLHLAPPEDVQTNRSANEELLHTPPDGYVRLVYTVQAAMQRTATGTAQPGSNSARTPETLIQRPSRPRDCSTGSRLPRHKEVQEMTNGRCPRTRTEAS
jgi:hypothetical protein